MYVCVRALRMFAGSKWRVPGTSRGEKACVREAEACVWLESWAVETVAQPERERDFVLA